MKLLFDENVSHRLVAALAHEFPSSSHVQDTEPRGGGHRYLLRPERERVERFGSDREMSLLILSITANAI